jgi:predicted phosphodiesterase
MHSLQREEGVVAITDRIIVRLADDGRESEAAAPQPDLDPESLAELSRAMQLLADAQGPSGVMSATEDETVSLLQTFLAKQASEGKIPTTRVDGKTLEAKFDKRDVGWAKVFLGWRDYLDRQPWIEAAEPKPVPNKMRLALFGDWATGLYGAPVSAQSIAKDGDYQVVLHLGDTYYSGDQEEVQACLMRPWPKIPGAIHRALNGNHEMYTGGNAYFQIAVKEFGQSASYFALENDHWILAALDTAYSGHDLHGRQDQWLQELVEKAGRRKVVLFSHHQPISIFEDQGPKLVKKLARLLTDQKIFAWYWGHEHRLALYDRHGIWGFYGRCVGHGGIPYFRDTKYFVDQAPSKPALRRVSSRFLVPGAQVLDGANDYVPEESDKYGPHGYMTLEFNGPELIEHVHEPDGNVLHASSLTGER